MPSSSIELTQLSRGSPMAKVACHARRGVLPLSLSVGYIPPGLTTQLPSNGAGQDCTILSVPLPEVSAIFSLCSTVWDMPTSLGGRKGPNTHNTLYLRRATGREAVYY